MRFKSCLFFGEVRFEVYFIAVKKLPQKVIGPKIFLSNSVRIT